MSFVPPRLQRTFDHERIELGRSGRALARRARVSSRLFHLSLLVLAASNVLACWSVRSSDGGGELDKRPPRVVNPEDVALLDGYSIEVVATGLKFPTGVAFDGDGTPHVTEAGYSYGEIFTTPRLVRVGPDGELTEVARGESEGVDPARAPVAAKTNGPWTGVVFHEGAFYVAEGGQTLGGRILRVSPDGKIQVLLSGLPSLGDHHTNGPAIGPDGKLYFGQGTATNSAVAGKDNHDFGWLKRAPEFHDRVCRDVKLTDQSFESENILTPEEGDRVRTSAFAPFGTVHPPGFVATGTVPCSGAVMRIGLDGGPPELVAWGFRNPFGLAFSPDGQLYVTDNGYDNRGSRPLFGSADVLWRVEEGGWHGWPDFAESRPVGEFYRAPGADAPKPLFAEAPGTPPKPVAYFGVHSSSNGLDFSRSEAFGFAGHAFVAQFGDQAPVTSKVFGPVGYKIVRVDVKTGDLNDFAVNLGEDNGPASKLGTGGLERPVAVRFDPSGESLYVVDFGVLAMSEKGAAPREGTGVLWRIRRSGR